MSKNECKQRFKGVESFLRRIAFNLGNTPSQTEVKVISCIPIDVTDLQHKIIQLEKQLEQQQTNVNVNNKKSQKGTSAVHTAICNTSCAKNSNAETSCKSIGCRQTSDSSHNQNCSTKQKRSTVSIVYSTGTSQAHDCFYSTEVSEMTCTKKRKPIECRKIFFNKRKVPKKAKIKTQLVYYAQTEENNPFNNYYLADDGTSKKRVHDESNNFNRSYLSNMFREQYKHGPVHEESNLSEFSTPICRDVTHTPKIEEPQPHESDMCSCCHGQFQNIDNHMRKNRHDNLDIFSSQTDSNDSYYDANLYDVVPVKENAVKVKNLEFPKRKELRHQMDIACWPGNVRPRYKVSPMIVNYSTTSPTQQLLRKVPVNQHGRKEKELKKTPTKCYSPVNQETSTKHLNARSVEFSEVYAKRLRRNSRKISKTTPTKVMNNGNDASCLTTVIASTECQTTSATTEEQENKNEQILTVTLAEARTKDTLNQIKDILQSVLTEVKTNSKTENILAQTKKKDAVVQNGLSQSNIYGGSSLLQSFTYSPYNMNPYGPSCSQQRHSPSTLCYPNLQPSAAKCMQNYPLFIQPGRNTCTSYYGNNSHVNKLPAIKRAASTATNTEDSQIRSKETENLIKEIYKAMALNIEIPTEHTRDNEQGDKHQNYNTRSEDREAKHIAKAISEIFKNTNLMHSSVTQNTHTPCESKLTSNKASFRFQFAQNNAQPGGKDIVDVNSDNASDNDETEQVLQDLESDEESDGTIVNEVTESSTSETERETDNDVAKAVEEPNMVKEKEKRGLFSKMLKIFMPKSRNRKKNKRPKENQHSDNDSDDYQTAHSHRVAPTKPAQKSRSKSRPVVYYSKKPRSPVSLPRRTPYMEQEYRRYFDEKLAFHDKQYTRTSTLQSAPQNRPVYCQKVEARSALIDYFNQRNQPRQVPPKMETKSIKQCRNVNQETYTRVKSDFPEKVSIVPPKATTWLEKHKLGIHCGKQWKKLIIDG